MTGHWPGFLGMPVPTTWLSPVSPISHPKCGWAQNHRAACSVPVGVPLVRLESRGLEPELKDWGSPRALRGHPYLPLTFRVRALFRSHWN